jgi:hypothetical protein
MILGGRDWLMAIAIIATGLFWDMRAVAACDGKCRERRCHKECDDGTCILFDDAICLECANGSPYFACVDRGEVTRLTPNCLIPDSNAKVNFQWYDSCTELCDCSVLHTSEADPTTLGSPIQNSGKTSRYKCGGPPAPP